jgi:predicted DNA-binding protein with PD1-like motif
VSKVVSAGKPRWMFLRLNSGEELISRLQQELQAQQPPWPSALISGIGSVRKAELGYYRMDRKEYLRREFPEVMELVSLDGNVSWMEGRPFVHAHAILSGEDFRTAAGHLFRAEVAATVEIFLEETELTLTRRPDGTTGLKLLDPGKHHSEAAKHPEGSKQAEASKPPEPVRQEQSKSASAEKPTDQTKQHSGSGNQQG